MNHKQKPYPETYTLQLGSHGRLVLPAPLRKQLGLNTGDCVFLIVKEDGTVQLATTQQLVEKLDGLFADVAPEEDWASELIAERHAEAERE